jgi:hypothetical protein
MNKAQKGTLFVSVIQVNDLAKFLTSAPDSYV